MCNYFIKLNIFYIIKNNYSPRRHSTLNHVVYLLPATSCRQEENCSPTTGCDVRLRQVSFAASPSGSEENCSPTTGCDVRQDSPTSSEVVRI